jgi:hypothetical protein
MRWRADGSKRNDPAKAYIREDGHYILPFAHFEIVFQELEI